MTELIHAWLLSLLVTFAPPEKLAAAPQLKGWEETAEQKHERYTAIVSDLMQVVYAPEFKPMFAGDKGRERTAALLLAVAFHESGFAKDVDVGPCYRKGKWVTRCDGGNAACLMQVWVGKGKTPEGWTQEELFADRKKCFTAGLNGLKRSWATCKKNPPETRFAAYASGSCDRGHKGAKELWALYKRFASRHPIPQKKDDAKEKVASNQ